MRRSRAQIIVELAIALPVLMFAILGATEIGFLVIAKAAQDRATAEVAEFAAGHPDESWNAVAARVLPGCDVTKTEPLPDLVEISAVCHHAPIVLPVYSGLPISSQETASRQPEPAFQSPTAAASASSSSTP